MSYETFFFEEIDGNKRKITLAGTEAPMGGPRRGAAFDLGGSVRKSEQFDPGSEAPNVHITGTTEHEIAVKGHFRDVLTGTAGGALARMAVIDSMRRAARPMRLVWGGILRRGLLATAKFGAESDSDIPYELTFSIYDHGVNRRTKSRRIPFASIQNFAVIEPRLASVKALASLDGIRPDLSSGIFALYSQLTAPLAQIIALTEDFEDGIASTIDALRSVASQAKALMLRCVDLFAFLSAIDPNSASSADDAAVRAAWTRAQMDALVNLQLAISEVQEVGVNAEIRASANSERIVTAAFGDTLETIGARFGRSFEVMRSLNPTLRIGPLDAGTKVRA